MSDTTLATVVSDLRAYADTIESMGESDPLYQEALEAMASSVTQSATKVENFGCFLKKLESEQKYLAEEVKRIQQRAQTMANLEQRLRDYAIRIMQENGIRKVSGKTLSLSLRKNGDACEITDINLVPNEYKRTSIKVDADKNLIKGALKAGEEVPGACVKVGGDRLDVS